MKASSSCLLLSRVANRSETHLISLPLHNIVFLSFHFILFNVFSLNVITQNFARLFQVMSLLQNVSIVTYFSLKVPIYLNFYNFFFYDNVLFYSFYIFSFGITFKQTLVTLYNLVPSRVLHFPSSIFLFHALRYKFTLCTSPTLVGVYFNNYIKFIQDSAQTINEQIHKWLCQRTHDSN